MKRIRQLGAALLAGIAAASAAHAHHTGMVYEQTAFWIEGKVVGYEAISPHTLTRLETVDESGRVQRWAIEGPAQTQLERRLDDKHIPQVGEVLAICAFPYKQAEGQLRPVRPDADGVPAELVAGHVMVTGDGERQIWEGHGVIGECIRSSEDERQAWLEFVNASPDVRGSWCRQMQWLPADAQGFAEEFNSLLDEPCD